VCGDLTDNHKRNLVLRGLTQPNIGELNMKKLILAAGMVLAMLASAHPALAAHPTVTIPKDCKQLTSNGNWPTGYVYYCGAATSADGNDVYSSIGSEGNADFIQTRMSANGGPFFVYQTRAAYATDFGVTAPPAGTDGLTHIVNLVPQYTAVFVQDSIADIAGANPLANAAVHELGHWLDFIDGKAITKSKQVSLTSQYTIGLTNDWSVFNGKTAVNGAFTKQCGAGGIFTGQQDPVRLVNGQHPYICDGVKGTGNALSATYSGTTSQGIVEDIYQPIFEANDEVFAEALPVILGFRNDGSGTTFDDSDHFMDNSVSQGLFGCTESLVSSMFFNGTLPSTSPPGLTCPTN
jgi:hypothetical protein